MLLAGCAGGDDAGRERPLILGYSSELQTLNPLVSTDQNANEVIYYLLYTPLVVYDSAFDVRPWLAESWELGDAEVVFTLRDDVRWHDGEPVTVEDVKFTFDRAVDPASGSPLGAVYLADVESAEILDARRIRFRFRGPQSQPLESFFWPPVPEHLLGDVAAEELNLHPFNRSPVGSGPYRLVRWQAGEQLVFEGFPEFAPSLGGPPSIPRAIYRIIPERTTLLAEFLSGEVDVYGTLSPAEAERLTQPTVRLVAFPWRMFTYIGWNLRRDLFADAAVRRALTMAIDREEIVAAVLGGRGVIATGPIPPWLPYAPGIDPLPYAPDSASALLEGAGWVDMDGDGVRERDGQAFRFALMTSATSPVLTDVVQIVQAQLARVGIGVEPQLLEWQAVLSAHRARDFDAVLTNWVLDNFRVDPRPLFHSSQAAREGSANRSSYASPLADSLLDVGATVTDAREAERVWREFSLVLQQDQPLTFLFWSDELAGVTTALSGVQMDARGELQNLPRWVWRSDGGENR